MQIGVPTETAVGETRVAVTPETAKKLVAQGHTVLVQSGAGRAASAVDEAYQAVGAQITDAASALGAELVLKVRAPSDSELTLMRPGATLVGMVYAFLPLTVFPVYAALQPIDRRLIEAGADLGAGPAETFLRITLPLSLPGVLAAALFVFVPSMGVFAIPVLLGGGKDIILGNLIVQLFLEFRNIPLGAAVSMLLLAFAGLGILLYMRALRRVEAMR